MERERERDSSDSFDRLIPLKWNLYVYNNQNINKTKL